MGVQGWNWWLRQTSWLPSSADRNDRHLRHNHTNSHRPHDRTSLWRDDWYDDSSNNISNNNNNTLDDDNGVLQSRLQALPRGSTLHVDGLGLAFWVLDVAFARHVEAVHASNNNELLLQRTHGSSNNNSNLQQQQEQERLKSQKTLTAARQMRSCLPSFLPLDLVTAAVHEYLDALILEAGCEVRIYWDGPERVMLKQSTTKLRQQRFPEEWARWQAYCEHGLLESRNNSRTKAVLEWIKLYPCSRLFLAQVKHALQTKLDPANMIFCDQEADAVIAKEVHTTNRARPLRSCTTTDFVVGNDSDFCFFRNAPYISFETLRVHNSNDNNNTTTNNGGCISNGVATAVVMDRASVAASMGIPHESLLVECALLLGNDYCATQRQSSAASNMMSDDDGVEEGTAIHDNNNNNTKWTPETAVQFLSKQDETYLVPGVDEEHQEALDYSRALYNFRETCMYETFDDDDDDNVGNNYNGGGDNPAGVDDDDNDNSDVRIRVPSRFNMQLAKLRVLEDTSVKDAVLRALEAYLDVDDDNGTTGDDHLLLPAHVDVFREMPMPCSNTKNNNGDEEDKVSPTWRPLWENVAAAYLIEKTIAYCYANSNNNNSQKKLHPILRHYTPYDVFDQQLFHKLMIIAQHSSNNVDSSVILPEAIDDDGEDSSPPERLVLPVDEHKDTIMQSVYKNRVTIIQGETGCGKSSRIPVFLLNSPSPNPTQDKPQLYISQPRRIAAKALVERIRATEPELRDQIALRMGHGVKEYQTANTRAWFVTTGYLVRLLANNPERFTHISYIVIDEVHERSVDSDLLCLLCRRLLHTNSQIRLVLMSATLAASMYQEYFGTPEPPIKVGARRFPVKEVYLDDLVDEFSFKGKQRKAIESMLSECERTKCISAPSANAMDKACETAVEVALRVGKPGSSVLIFCSGMNEIVTIIERVEDLFVAGVRYTCLPIHSDIPFDDQMNVFNKAAADEVKLIVATNAAESSVTLPDVDHVICLGLCKQITYNALSHRQMLAPTWISKASATQRAGRTGRVRPGTVYRLYSRDSFESHFADFEPGEMLRIPLDSVILMLKDMLVGEPVTEVLLSCLEPPNLNTVERSYKSLHDSNFISSPEDESAITSLGSFVLALGVDLELGAIVGLGAQFGIAAEAIQLAAVLSFPKTPWIMSNPLVHKPKDYNEMTAKTYVSKCHFDANLISEPFAAMNLIWEFEKSKNAQSWCWSKGVNLPRIRRLSSTAKNLRRRVAEYLQITPDSLELDDPPLTMPHGKITLLRIVQTWVLKHSMIEMQPLKSVLNYPDSGEMRIDIHRNSDQITRPHLNQVLCDVRHPFELLEYNETTQKGEFSTLGPPFDFQQSFAGGMEERLLSLAIEKELDVLWIHDGTHIYVYIAEDARLSNPENGMIEGIPINFIPTQLVLRSAQGRGIRERAAGKWIHDTRHNPPDTNTRVFEKFEAAELKPKEIKKACLYLGKIVREKQPVSALSCDLSGLTNNKKKAFHIVTRGPRGKLSKPDLKDAFGSAEIALKEKLEGFGQSIVFRAVKDKPKWGAPPSSSSWERPIVKNVPEGARLLNVLLAGRRRETVVKFSPIADSQDGGNPEPADDEDGTIDMHIKNDGTNMQKRWKRFNSDSLVYVSENSVPASTVHTKDEILYCCCANSLEVRGGGLRVEGLTMLPPGRRFLMLCRITFGLCHHDNLVDGSFVEKSMEWVFSGNAIVSESTKEDFRDRIEQAIAFEAAARDLGEELICFERKVEQLLSIFDQLDGYNSRLWDNFFENPLIGSNLKKLQQSKRRWKKEAAELSLARKKPVSDSRGGHLEVTNKPRSTPSERPLKTIAAKAGIRKSKVDKQNSQSSTPIINLEPITLDGARIPDAVLHTSPSAASVRENKLFATNILALVVETSQKQINHSGTDTTNDWALHVAQVGSDACYFASYLGRRIPHSPRAAKWTKQQLWIKEDRLRPNTIKSSLACVPPTFARMIQPLIVLAKGEKLLVFQNAELAMQMEACFWLERHFATHNIHWYQRQLDDMVLHLIHAHNAH